MNLCFKLKLVKELALKLQVLQIFIKKIRNLINIYKNNTMINILNIEIIF